MNNNKLKRSIFSALEDYLELNALDEANTWEEHEEAVKSAEEAENEAGTDVPSRIEVLASIVEDVLYKIDAGILIVESGEELLATVQAVEVLEQIEAGLHVK